jgi:radical SAM protein with 4Fe4S-binding SPASM domain
MAEPVLPSHIKRVTRLNIEEILAETTREKFGARFQEYRDNYHRSLQYEQSDFLPDFPITLGLELLNRCNLECIMCNSSHRAGPKFVISDETLERIMEECKQHELPAIMFGMGEEPLLYKDIGSVLDKAQSAGIMDVFLFTNGTLLTEERCRQIVEKQITRVMISIDAANPETYDKIRVRNGKMEHVGANRLEALEENIKRLIRIRDEMGSALPVVRVSFVVQPLNVDEVDTFTEKWKDIVDFIDFQEWANHSMIDVLAKLPVEERWQRRPLEDKVSNPQCPAPFNYLTVWATGDVSPCCSFQGKNLFVGNIKDESLKEIWDGKKMAEIRDQFRTGELNIVCQNCLGNKDTTNFSKV